MSCPNCEHTMQRMTDLVLIFHCPRCGTVQSKNPMGKHYLTHTPTLVERAHKLAHLVERHGFEKMTEAGSVEDPDIAQAKAAVFESVTGKPFA